MELNPRVKKEIADGLNVMGDQLISYRPAPKLLRHSCGECKNWNAGVCDLGNGNRMALPADCHSCLRFQNGKDRENV